MVGWIISQILNVLWAITDIVSYYPEFALIILIFAFVITTYFVITCINIFVSIFK